MITICNNDFFIGCEFKSYVDIILLSSLSGWDLTSYIRRMLISDDFHFTEAISCCDFPISTIFQ